MRRLSRLVLAALAAVALLLVVFAVAGATYTPNTEIPPGVPGKQVVVLGISLRVVQEGAGRDILFIHGSPGSVEDGRPVIDPLSRDFRVTAYDRPGNGYSGDSGKYSVEYNADVALALIHTLGLKRVVVVGHSYGGATAVAMALRNDPAVASYVILDSAVYVPSRQPDATLRALDVPLIGMGFARLVAPSVAPKKIRAGLLEQFPFTPPTEDFVTARIAIWSSPKVTHAIAEETLGSAANLAAMSPRYASIKGPVTILAQAGNALRRSAAEKLHATVQGSSLELLDGTGHYVQFEKAADVVAAVRKAAAAP